MEVSELQSGQGGKIRCQYCRKWVHLADLNLKGKDDLAAAPCPQCGKTGADVRAKQEEVMRALEAQGLDIKS